MNQLDDREVFDSLIKHLWKYPADFCLIFRKTKSWRQSLNLQGAFSFRYKSTHDGEKAGEEYRLLADDCYRQSLDRIIEELIDPRSKTWMSAGVWKAKIFKALKIGTPTPANSIGQRWWLLVVASGPTHKLGYSIVTRVAARNIAELRHCVKGIQEIMQAELRLARGKSQRA